MKIKENSNEGYSGQSKAEEIKNWESLSIDLGRTENKKQRSDLNESSTPMQFSKLSIEEQERVLTTKGSSFSWFFISNFLEIFSGDPWRDSKKFQKSNLKINPSISFSISVKST